MKNPEKKPYLWGMIAGFGAISLSVVFFFLIYRLQGVGAAVDTLIDILMPFIYGGVIAYLLRPVCNWYSGLLSRAFKGRHRKWSEALAVTLSMITGMLVVYALIIMIAPQLYYSIVTLWETIPAKVEQLVKWATETFGENEVLLRYFNTGYTQIYTTLENWAAETLAPYITNIVSGVGMSVWKVLLFVKDLLIGLIVAVYLLGSRKRFGRQCVILIRSIFKPKWADMVLNEVSIVDRMFGGFIEGKLVDSAIIGVLCYIGCSIFKFPNALLVSAIVGVTNVIPFFGPFLGAIPSILLILIESPIKALWFALFVLALQQLDGNVIGPKILGQHTGVSSFWVLFSILLFGGLWGLVGMIIAVPLFAVIYDILKKLVLRGLRRNGCTELMDEYKTEYPDSQTETK
ncbi:MAG: AI-2E family transporter [Oscillospiraceae bacterium]|nr:AI-2E family transporter [Oscillospiraceae bacterium]